MKKRRFPLSVTAPAALLATSCRKEEMGQREEAGSSAYWRNPQPDKPSRQE